MTLESYLSESDIFGEGLTKRSIENSFFLIK